MHSLIIGGGKIGYYLTKVLIEKGYDVSVVEKEKEACQKFANDLNITVIKGDGTSVSVLEQAGVAGGYFLVHRFVVGAAQCPHIGGNGVPAQLLVAQVGLKFFQCGPVELVEVNNLASAEFAESVQGTLIDVCRAITCLLYTSPSPRD